MDVPIGCWHLVGSSSGYRHLWGDVMEAGLQVMNNNNTLNIDSTYKNMELLGKYTVITSTAIWSGTYTGTVVVPGVNLMVGSRSTSPSTVFMVSESNGNSTVTVISKTAGLAVTVFAFGPPTTVQGNMGMQVFNQASQLVFDATHKYLRMRSVTAVTFSPTGSAQTFNFPDARSYICVPSQPFSMYTVSSSGIPPSNWTIARANIIWMHTNNGSSATFNRQTAMAEVYQSNAPASLTQTRLTGTIMMIDVTGF